MLTRDIHNFKDTPTSPWCIYEKHGKQYKLFPGDTAIVDPCSKAKGTEKLRGRHCLVLWLGYQDGKVGIKYLDSGRYGERKVHDLIPLPRKPIDILTFKAKAKV